MRLCSWERWPPCRHLCTASSSHYTTAKERHRLSTSSGSRFQDVRFTPAAYFADLKVLKRHVRKAASCGRAVRFGAGTGLGLPFMPLALPQALTKFLSLFPDCVKTRKTAKLMVPKQNTRLEPLWTQKNRSE